jgi:Protein of unknown function (DUF3365)
MNARSSNEFNLKGRRGIALLGLVCFVVSIWADTPQEEHPQSFPAATTRMEARARALLLYESIRGTLQVVHRDFFNDEDSTAIPSASFEDVFKEISRSYNVQLKWLNVETDVVNIDHQPEGDFEEAAVIELKKGANDYDDIEGKRYRFAGPIPLASQCLKCHVKNRTSTEARTAGLLISMPLEVNP